MSCKIILFQLTAPPLLSEAWLINCMSVRSVLRCEGITTRSLKQITRKNSYTALSSPHAPLPSFQIGEFFISEQNPLKASFFGFVWDSFRLSIHFQTPHSLGQQQQLGARSKGWSSCVQTHCLELHGGYRQSGRNNVCVHVTDEKRSSTGTAESGTPIPPGRSTVTGIVYAPLWSAQSVWVSSGTLLPLSPLINLVLFIYLF